jgi:predicted enzyme related to lactoylglutathione lyase
VAAGEWVGTTAARRRSRALSLWRLALGLALLSACATSERPPRPLPPIADPGTQLQLPGKFVWLDLVTADGPAVTRFYGDLFGWSFEEGQDSYLVRNDGRPIAGIVIIRPDQGEGTGSAWVPSLSVRDVDEAVAVVRREGGAVDRGPLDVEGRGRMALVDDPGGAVLVLLRASGGDPADAEPPIGDWLWRELWTRDAAAAIAFYRSLADFQENVLEFPGQSYTVLEQSGRPRAGVIEAPMREFEPQWLPYVHVEDPEQVVERARSLGARVVLQDEDAAILVDPGGAAFGVQRRPDPASVQGSSR